MSPVDSSNFDDTVEHEIPIQLWIDWHLNIPGNEFLVPVSMQFLLDQFNMFEFTGEEAQYPETGADNSLDNNKNDLSQGR